MLEHQHMCIAIPPKPVRKPNFWNAPRTSQQRRQSDFMRSHVGMHSFSDRSLAAECPASPADHIRR